MCAHKDRVQDHEKVQATDCVDKTDSRSACLMQEIGDM